MNEPVVSKVVIKSTYSYIILFSQNNVLVPMHCFYTKNKILNFIIIYLNSLFPIYFYWCIIITHNVGFSFSNLYFVVYNVYHIIAQQYMGVSKK